MNDRMQKKFKQWAIIASALFISLGIVFLLVKTSVVSDKKNDIPVYPLAYKLALVQSQDRSLAFRSIQVIEGYAPDYLAELPKDYYRIEILNGERTLYKGKIPSVITTIEENFSPDDETAVEQVTKTENRGEFDMVLPYYEKATKIRFSDEEGREVLVVNVNSFSLEKPQTKTNYCNDGICADNENIFTCYPDCSQKLRSFFERSD
ncbi:MAG: hypothetical protein US54_C0067G0003 [Candidatus Roizmanbacteria bacterium GW2011_GWA2_37_7]|uniref:Uncharacterized protein n=1 Tax=Candidatus Roizmanbacteria bacterium GW2011_GWA2_37_7 TaxID=1618481 RepID=A0A0G0H2Q4_9BACT|nr:MAG: hypothetical protein US54_C0067G0003 [Candidatus Roizmanbacteria bacterium GW2011_GWA2_37_7]